jgi:hypothetical protein
MGYDFAAAVADLVDNSIEAGASLVAIDVEFDGDDSWVRIADDGKGMTPDELREAMRYGAERDYDEEDLGKFGLGLKTASMSQCKRLSVASRSSRGRADITAYCWDLDHIERTNRWEIIPLEKTGVGPAVRTPLKDNTGTVVLWQQLDRILGYKHPYGESARRRISQMCRELEDHLGMVFHRFLKGEVRDKKLRVMLNGNEVQAWDPFCRAERATKKLEKMRIPVEHEGVKGQLILEPFVLPHQDDFATPEAFRRASGPANWNQQQGFYIYRAGRMIQSGGWCRLRTPDEHTKLARVGLSFSPALDEAFKINVAKMRVQLPASVRDEIARVIGPVVKLARESYDRKPRSKPGPRGKVSEETRVPSGSGNRPGASPGAGDGPDRRLLTLDQVADLLREVATDAEQPVVESIIRRLRKVLRGTK